MAITKLEITGNTTAVGITQVPVTVSAANEAGATTINPIVGITGGTVQSALQHIQDNKAEKDSPVVDDITLNGLTNAQEIFVESTTGAVPYVHIGSQNNQSARFDMVMQDHAGAEWGTGSSKGARFELNGVGNSLDVKCDSGTNQRTVMQFNLDGAVHFRDNQTAQAYAFSVLASQPGPKVVSNLNTEINGDITNTGTLSAPYGITTDYVNLGDQSLTTFKQGTWTPQFSWITFSVANADYMQIGNMVVLSISIYDVDTSLVPVNTSSAFQVNNLPISPRQGTANATISSACVFDFHDLDFNTSMYTQVIKDGPGTVPCIRIFHGHDKTALTFADIPNTATTGQLDLQVTYFV
jgi:hypothetical protein